MDLVLACKKNANAGSLQVANGWINFFRTTKNTKTKQTKDFLI